jgi:hypothetical protein
MRAAIRSAVMTGALGFLAGCGGKPAQSIASSQLTLQDRGGGVLELALDAQDYYRALQATLVYDQARVTIDTPTAGSAAPWLDITRAGGTPGRLVVVASNTLQIPLPRTGSIVAMHYALTRGGQASVALADVWAATATAERTLSGAGTVLGAP